MHFGRLNTVSGVDFSLPPDSSRTEKFLSLQREPKTTDFYIGCPIWSSSEWVGTFYPKGTKPKEYLKNYAQFFNTVELNSTFYHLLAVDRIAQWQKEVPSRFRFCPKVYRGITENLIAREMPQLVKKFCDSISAFENNLGLTFAQLPETFSPAQLPILENFLKVWPTQIPLAVEFRHPAWFIENTLLDPVVNLLYRHKIATVITDTAGRRDVLHTSLTWPKIFIRFQGNEGVREEERLRQWGERLRKWARHSLEEIYFFTHQPSDEKIPETAFQAAEEIEQQKPLRPKFLYPNVQGSLID